LAQDPHAPLDLHSTHAHNFLKAAMTSPLEMQAIENTIADFLQDPASQSMEFPNLTAQQRKHAKTVLEKHPELYCESYGFGKERKLNVFKKSPIASSTVTIMDFMAGDILAGDAACMVNVKNTFIDDWTSAEKEPFILRSMPAHLPTSSVQCVMDGPVCKIDLPSVKDDEHSTVAPSSCESDDGSDTSVPPSLPDWFFPPPGLDIKVKNTFVHFAETSADERAVQSMPGSMFRKCLLLESLLAEPGEAPVADASPRQLHIQPDEQQHEEEAPTCQVRTGDEVSDTSLMVNDEIVIQRLAKCPAFNGLTGTVQAFDAPSGRYSVLLSSPIDGNKTVMLKRENCQLLTLEAGTEVVIEGLLKCPTFNGLQGTVQLFDSQSGRYKILISSPELGKKTAMLKRDNCRSVSLAAGTEVVIEGLSKYPAFNGLRGKIQAFEEQSERYNILLSSSVNGCKSTMVKRKNLRVALST